MTVVLPFFSGDVSALRELLIWIGQLGGPKKYAALLVADAATQWSDCGSLLDLSLSIFGEAMLTVTHTSTTGWPAGSNALFLHASQEMSTIGQPWLWLEP